MANLLTAALTGANYILHAAGIMETYMVSSLEKFVLDEENCGIVKHIRKGIPVNEDTLAFDVIRKGPGCWFSIPITHLSTLQIILCAKNL